LIIYGIKIQVLIYLMQVKPVKDQSQIYFVKLLEAHNIKMQNPKINALRVFVFKVVTDFVTFT